jgi:hypothetical protein
VSNLTRVSQYTCQIVHLMSCTFDTRFTRVKVHVSKCLTRVQHCTRVKLHVSKCGYFCSAASYEESWAGLQWVVSHANRNGPEPWLNEYADFNRVFIGGDS